MGRVLAKLSAHASVTFPVQPVPFNSEVYDTDGAFNPAVPGVFVVPAGFNFFKAEATVEVNAGGDTGSQRLTAFLNGVETICSFDSRRNSNVGYSDNICGMSTPWLPCSPGDTIEFRADVSGLGNPPQIRADLATWACIEFEA